MKKILFVCLLCQSLFASAQEIEKTEIDKFTKQRRIKTSAECVKNGLSEVFCFWIRSVDSTIFLNAKGRNFHSGVIGSSDEMILLLEGDQTVTLRSTGVQSYEPTRNGNYFDHQYSITLSELQLLSEKKLLSIRKYTSKGYYDIDVPKRNDDALQELVKVFLKELNKK